MRAHLIASDLSLGSGWGRYAYEVARGLSGEGVAVTVHVAGPAPETPIEGVEIRALAYRPGAGLASAAAAIDGAAAIRRAMGPKDILHALDESVLPLAEAARLLSRRSFFISIHGTHAAVRGGRGAWIRRSAYRHAQGIFANSAYTASRFAAVQSNTGPVIVAPLGVAPPDTGDIPPHRAREPSFLLVGAVKPRKGVVEAARAFAAIAAVRSDSQFYVAGDLGHQAYVADVRAVISSLGLTDRFHLLGRVGEQELRALYRRVSGFVLPSQNVGGAFEGFGLVHLEAARAGLPAIGCLDCGNEEAIKDGETGFLIGQDDLGALTDRMGRLIASDFDWDGMSAKALAFAGEMSWRRPVARYLAAYGLGAGKQ